MAESESRDLYLSAVLETDRNTVPDRIKAAEDAIRVRASLDAQVSSDERMAIKDAMAALLAMRRESLNATR
jgi:Cdc6-like AAA superfamily ATPase